MKIAVDVLGAMKVARKSYRDTYAFIAELLQNADRAGATRVDIYTTSDSVIVRNDGEVCTDLKSVFTSCVSGWGASVVKTQDPFGTGFFSVMCVADHVSIRSGNKKADWDVERMFTSQVLDVVKVTRVAHYPGFEVVLSKLKGIEEAELEAKINEVSLYLAQAVYLNGNRIYQIAEDQPTEGELEAKKWLVRVNRPGIRGVIFPERWGSVSTYFQKRYVEKIYRSCVAGRLFIDAGTLDPVAPDRSAWITNNNYYELMTWLSEQGREMLLRIIKEGSNEDVDHFADKIDYELKPEEYEDDLLFGEVFKAVAEVPEPAPLKVAAKAVPTTITAAAFDPHRLQALPVTV
jgi:hypothetical protein